MRMLAYFFAEQSPVLLETVVEDQTYNYWGELVNMLLTLGLVIGVIFFSVWMMKRLGRAKWKTMGSLQAIRVIERRSLSPKSSLFLLEILGKGVVIADSPAGITLVKEFPDDVDIDQLIQEKIEVEQVPRLSLSRRIIQKLGLAGRAG